MLRRRWARAACASQCRPASSGPRCVMTSRIAQRARRRVLIEPVDRNDSAMPHMSGGRQFENGRPARTPCRVSSVRVEVIERRRPSGRTSSARARPRGPPRRGARPAPGSPSAVHDAVGERVRRRPGGTSSPVRPSSISSRMPPTPEATIGRPAAIASRTALGNDSDRDGRTKMSAVGEPRRHIVAMRRRT